MKRHASAVSLNFSDSEDEDDVPARSAAAPPVARPAKKQRSSGVALHFSDDEEEALPLFSAPGDSPDTAPSSPHVSVVDLSSDTESDDSGARPPAPYRPHACAETMFCVDCVLKFCPKVDCWPIRHMMHHVVEVGHTIEVVDLTQDGVMNCLLIPRPGAARMCLHLEGHTASTCPECNPWFDVSRDVPDDAEEVCPMCTVPAPAGTDVVFCNKCDDWMCEGCWRSELRLQNYDLLVVCPCCNERLA